jgi:uncharacterized repeat protein (TIGR01451 family)
MNAAVLFCALSLSLSARLYDNESCRNATGAFQYRGSALGYTDALSVNPDPVVDLTIENIDNMSIQSPFYVATYKDEVSPAKNITVDSSMVEVFPGERDIVRVNDRGEGENVRPECGIAMQSDRFILRANDLLAKDDYATTFDGVFVRIPPLTNDIIPNGCTPTLKVMKPTKHGGDAGVLEVNNVATDTIGYFSPSGFVGYDTIIYNITCSGNTSTAYVIVKVQEYPDNVDEQDCIIDPDARAWSARLTQQIDSLSTTSPFVVGDLNDDGFPDIAGYGDKYNRSIRVIWGPDFSTDSLYPLPASEIRCAIAIAKVKTADNPLTYRSMIYYQINDLLGSPTNRLYAMDPIDGSPIWQTDAPSWNIGAIGVADFNNDGWAEVYVGNQIYDAATGKLLCRGYQVDNSGRGDVIIYKSSMLPAIDILGDERLELVAGNLIYKVDIDRNSTNPSDLTPISWVSPPAGCPNDGFTVVADFNNDGKPEVLVRQKEQPGATLSNIHLYLWSPHTGTDEGKILAETIDYNMFAGVPFVGDIDGDGSPEIVTLESDGRFNVSQPGLKARKYNEASNMLDIFWNMDHTDETGATGMTLFDFNNDGISEIVYRDESELRIINGSKKDHLTGFPVTDPYPLATFTSYSLTGVEYPIVADIYGNGSSAILVTSDYGGPRQDINGRGLDSMATVDIFTSGSSIPWMPARKVWNQYAYNAVNVNEDLTVPAVQLNLATRFPGADGVIGTEDDVRPYNAFLQQQTTLNKVGTPLRLAPDAVFDPAQTSVVYDGDSVWVNVCITNEGDAALSNPVYLSLYRDYAEPDKFVTTDSIMEDIRPFAGACLTIGAKATELLPSASEAAVQLVVRLNDRGPGSQGAGSYPFQPECMTCCDSVEVLFNPAIRKMMEKHAALNGDVENDGRYANPVSALYGDTVKYKIIAVNANLKASGMVIIRDTLPPYLKYVDGSAQVIVGGSSGNVVSAGTTSSGTPQRGTVQWVIPNVVSRNSVEVRFKATLVEGVAASQPLFINTAYVTVSDTVAVPTNSTYHQGAGVAVVTFSAAAGGSIYNADRQALDYRTSPREGVLVVPNSGYVFAGWRHDAYVSLRGELIPADSCVMRLDSFLIYGNVELRATFVPASETTATEKDAVTADRKGDKVWSNGGTLYVLAQKGGKVCLYTPDGILRRQFVTTADDVMTCRLDPGIYIVTLNGGAGYKVLIE